MLFFAFSMSKGFIVLLFIIIILINNVEHSRREIKASLGYQDFQNGEPVVIGTIYPFLLHHEVTSIHVFPFRFVSTGEEDTPISQFLKKGVSTERWLE